MAENDTVGSTPKTERQEAASALEPALANADLNASTRHGPSPAQAVFLAAGLAVLGFLAAVLVLMDSNTGGDASQAALAASWLRALWLVLAFGLAGWAAFIALRTLSVLHAELLNRESRRERQREENLGRAIRLLERIAQGIEQRPQSAGFEPVAPVRHTRSGNGLEDRLAQLKAAREVNDPTTVLELFRTIAPELEAEPRQVLQSEVAEWFITVIYRRLRTGKIQAEVVELAGRFAESFAATAQGASVRAALPMLRRSAGLCPRCVKPYTGTGQACPECVRSGMTTTLADLPAVDPD